MYVSVILLPHSAWPEARLACPCGGLGSTVDSQLELGGVGRTLGEPLASPMPEAAGQALASPSFSPSVN